MLPAGLLLSSYECPFVIRCKRRRLHRSKESCKQKRHTAQTFSLSVRVSLSCLLAYYTTLYVLLQFLFSCRLCGSVASPALLYCAPAPTFYENGSSSSIPSGMFIKPFASVSGCAGACWFPCCPAAALLSANSHSSTMTSVVYTLPPSLLV